MTSVTIWGMGLIPTPSNRPVDVAILAVSGKSHLIWQVRKVLMLYLIFHCGSEDRKQNHKQITQLTGSLCGYHSVSAAQSVWQ